MTEKDYEVTTPEQNELAQFTHAALSVIRSMAGDRKIEVAIVVGDPETHELMLSGHCCPGCTATLIEAAMYICEDMEKDGTIQSAAAEEKPN